MRLGLLIMLFGAFISGAQAAEKPNIVIILADDLGYADLGFRGSDIQTPNLDRLASEGMVLNRFYSLPICTPTRSALMTARDPIKLGTAYAGLQPWEHGGVSPEEHFMPESFRKAGYQTAMIGKWHIGRQYESLVPHHRGFDHFFGHLNTQVDYYTHDSAGGHDLQENGKSLKRDAYATDIHGDESVRFLKELRDPAKPFLLYVPFLAPHSPMQAPEELEAKYKSRMNFPIPKRTYAAMVDSMDQAIGRILDELDRQGVSDNTIILFFSDNGGFAGFGGVNKPYRGGKLETFEGGIRVNAIMRWPRSIPAGSETQQTISVMDVFPTLAAASGIEMHNEKKIDGMNILSALTKSKNMKRPKPLFFASNSPEYNSFRLAMIDGDHKLVQIIDHNNRSTEITNHLFDLGDDPYEKNNLAEENPLRVKKMSDAINDWRSQHPVSGLYVSISPNPSWRAPTDYAEDVKPDEKTILKSWGGFGRVASQVLQMRYGEKGRIKYE